MCVSRGRKTNSQHGSPLGSHDVSGGRSRSARRSDLTQCVSAWQPGDLAGRVQGVLSYLRGLKKSREGGIKSARLAVPKLVRSVWRTATSVAGDGAGWFWREGSVLRAPRSPCATGTMQTCKQGWPGCAGVQLVSASVGQGRALTAFGWGFPCSRSTVEQPRALPALCRREFLPGAAPWHSPAPSTLLQPPGPAPPSTNPALLLGPTDRQQRESPARPQPVFPLLHNSVQQK